MKTLKLDIFYDSIVKYEKIFKIYEITDQDDDDFFHLSEYFIYTTIMVKPKINKKFFKKNFLFKKHRNTYFHRFEIDASYLNMFVKKGMKFRYLKFVNQATAMVINLIHNKSNFLKEKFSNYTVIRDYFYSNDYINIKFILNHLFSVNYMVFGVFLCRNLIKKKKKRKLEYQRIFKYNKPNRRLSIFLRDLYYYSHKFNYTNITERILAALLTVLFLQKQSVMYKKKLYAYSKYINKIIHFE